MKRKVIWKTGGKTVLAFRLVPVTQKDGKDVLGKPGKLHVMGEDTKDGKRPGKRIAMCGQTPYLDKLPDGVKAVEEVVEISKISKEGDECNLCGWAFDARQKAAAKATEAAAAKKAKAAAKAKKGKSGKADKQPVGVSVKLTKAQMALLATADFPRPEGVTLEGTTLTVDAKSGGALVEALGKVEGKSARTAAAAAKKITTAIN